jgi:hypothetical protein
MSQKRWVAGLMVLGLFLAQTGTALAGRTNMTRNTGQKSTGSRNDITVPYLTSGGTNFGVYNSVAPRVYGSPIVDDPRNPGAKPVYNLIFYGSVQGYGDRSNGAVPKPK